MLAFDVLAGLSGLCQKVYTCAVMKKRMMVESSVIKGDYRVDSPIVF